MVLALPLRALRHLPIRRVPSAPGHSGAETAMVRPGGGGRNCANPCRIARAGPGFSRDAAWHGPCGPFVVALGWCGALGGGFARFRCSACGFDRLVPFSCRGRGFCQSCGGRRMVERAAHLVDHVSASARATVGVEPPAPSALPVGVGPHPAPRRGGADPAGDPRLPAAPRAGRR